MAENLNALSLALGLLASDPGVSPGEWSDYMWKTSIVHACISQQDCRVVKTRWDWKREQYVEVAIAPKGRGIQVSNRLINKDTADDDHVCVTVLFRDAGSRTVAVFHENRYSRHQTDETTQSELALARAQLSKIRSLAVGTKQCRGGPYEDDAIHERARRALGQQKSGGT